MVYSYKNDLILSGNYFIDGSYDEFKSILFALQKLYL